MSPEERQAVVDDEHLRLLALFHYVSGGITVAISFFFGVWMVFMGLMFSLFPAAAAADAALPHPEGPPAFLFVIFGLLFLLGVAYGILEIVAGWFIGRRRRRLFTMIAGLPRVLFIPYGVILTIFTLVVLDRPSVKQLYGEKTCA
jgi:hypothetical protein